MPSRGFRSGRLGGGLVNGNNVTNGLTALVEKAHREKDQSLRALAGLLVNETKRELSKPGTGRIYPRGKKKHRASAFGEPPAVDTGALRNSMALERQGDGSYRVGTGQDYAPHLEPPAPLNRPFLATAVARVRQLWGRTIIGRMKRASDAIARGGG